MNTAFFFYRRLCDFVDDESLEELAINKEQIMTRCAECFNKSIVDSINQPVPAI